MGITQASSSPAIPLRKGLSTRSVVQAESYHMPHPLDLAPPKLNPISSDPLCFSPLSLFSTLTPSREVSLGFCQGSLVHQFLPPAWTVLSVTAETFKGQRVPNSSASSDLSSWHLPRVYKSHGVCGYGDLVGKSRQCSETAPGTTVLSHWHV